jgi:ArsR family transcriptional regulator
MLNQRQAGAGDASDNARDANIAIEALATLCKASGDQLRLQVLQVLRQDSLAVQELCRIFDIRQPALSHHLKVMAAAGLVTSRREGNTIFYRRALPDGTTPSGRLHASLLASVDELPLAKGIEQHLAELRGERELASREFFQQNADKFRAQQDLIASYEQYADTVAQTLLEAPLQQRGLALEVGPGDGAFLPLLGREFEHVIALDNAAEMLASSEQRAGGEGLDNIEFVLGDTRHPRLQSIAADCIVVNMVLHHNPSPADILGDLSTCLAAGGVLLVTDLCRHDQDWARESCGDLWLGFEPGELGAWATSAGLGEIASIYLAQRNGFQIQVRLFGRHTDIARNNR